MIFLPRHLLGQINNSAEIAYPDECCGLLVGHHQGDKIIVTQVVASANVTQNRKSHSFEVEPKLRFDLMRQLKDSDQHIIGHYHSHPDHAAIPSRHDLEMASEAQLVWLIIPLINGKAGQGAAYLLDKDDKEFHKLELAYEFLSV